MIGVAMLGAGIFAQEEHLPAIEACPLYNLKAVYSRSQKSCETFAAMCKNPVDTYWDVPATEGKALDDLLKRGDIDATVVCMPIALQPEAIKRSLQAGKHVLSEKPIAETVATAEALIKFRRSLAKPPIWAVAENWRFYGTLEPAVAKLKEIGGDLVSFNLSMATLIQEDNRFWNTPWRKVPTHPGGFLLDGGIHHIAGLRSLLGATGEHITKVACFSSLLQPALLPIDTVRAVATTQSGASGLISISFGTEFGAGLSIEVVTTEGRIEWSAGAMKLTRRAFGAKQEETVSFQSDSEEGGVFPAGDVNGVKAEFAAFAASLDAGAHAVDPRQSPEEALQDLRLLEACFKSGEEGGVLKTVAEGL